MPAVISAYNARNLSLVAPYSEELVAVLRSTPGARWIKEQRHWRISLSLPAVDAVEEIARRFRIHIDSKARDLIGFERDAAALLLRLSEARTDADVAVASRIRGLLPFGKELLPFQPAAVEYALVARRIINGDKMGLGKTVESLAAIELARAYPTLVVCKKTALGHWRNQIARWLPARSVAPWDVRPLPEFSLATWGELSTTAPRPIELKGRRFPEYQGLILDESHHARNRHSRRTQIAREIAHGVPMRLLLSGSPVINRTSDLISQLEIIEQLNAIGGFWFFAKSFCAAFEGKFGWDLSGSSNLEELQRLLRSTCFVSREKKGPKGVLDSLPDKRREEIPVMLSSAESASYREAEKDVVAWLAANVSEEASTRAIPAEALVRLTTLKHLAARGKIGAAVAWIRDFCEDNPGEKLVVFAWHLDVIGAILTGVQVTTEKDHPAPKAAFLTGALTSTEREEQLAHFRRDAQVLVASLTVGGESIDLTCASTVLFVEFDWTPAAHEQAEDRCHRFGQKNPVIAYWLTAQGTIDDDVSALLESKQKIVGGVVGGAAPTIERPLIARMLRKERTE